MKDKLKNVPLFADLPDQDLEDLANAITVQQLEQGEMLFEEGDQGVTAYVIESGEIEILKISENRQVLLNVLGPGDVFGEMAFLLEQPRAADVYAATDGRILSLSEKTLRASISSDSEIAATLLLNISKILCRRVLKG